MARPLRIDVAGGWYHITARGHNRQRIYLDGRDRAQFLKRVAEMAERYRVEVHAYVLMPNHYHLLIKTPDANASRAIQWLNGGYGVWWNRRHGRSGHMFQGRFKGVLIESGSWALALSLYIHFNPVAVKSLGWGKTEKRAEALGIREPSAQIVRARLETLREHRWSSYRAYAGYERIPEWLETGEVLRRVRGGCEAYRKEAEERLSGGQREDLWSQLKWGAVLGSASFAEKLRKGLKVGRETGGRRGLRGRVAWSEVVRAVERVKGEMWASFRDRHGDWGRDLALALARRYGGMTLTQLGVAAGGMDYSAVSEAVRRFERTTLNHRAIRRAWQQAGEFLNLEMCPLFLL